MDKTILSDKQLQKKESFINLWLDANSGKLKFITWMIITGIIMKIADKFYSPDVYFSFRLGDLFGIAIGVEIGVFLTYFIIIGVIRLIELIYKEITLQNNFLKECQYLPLTKAEMQKFNIKTFEEYLNFLHNLCDAYERTPKEKWDTKYHLPFPDGLMKRICNSIYENFLLLDIEEFANKQKFLSEHDEYRKDWYAIFGRVLLDNKPK